MSFLEAVNLSVDYLSRGSAVRAVRNVSFSLSAGETLGVVGESGCGKSTLAMAVLRLLPETSRISGKVLWQGRDILSFSPEELRKTRGGKIGVVFQDPFSALNPVLTLGEQVEEVLEAHAGGRSKQAALEIFRQVRLADPERIYKSYPHQVSGGQRQRAVIALAVASKPKLLIADEPTTALDATIQKEVLNLLDQLKLELSMSMLLITHNLGLVWERTERVAVMYAGEIVEMGATAQVLRAPKHPYTQGLINSLPRLRGQGAAREPLAAIAGQPPDLRSVPPGCPFHPRCPRVFDPCGDIPPSLQKVGGMQVACHLYNGQDIAS